MRARRAAAIGGTAALIAAGARIRRLRWFPAAALLAAMSAPADPQPARAVREAASFDRSSFTDPAAVDRVRAAGNLRGPGCCVSGWAEYDFRVDVAGWHQIWVIGGALEYLVDPPADPTGEPAAYFAGGSGAARQPDKVGNVWLEAGVHHVRVQTYLWNGFSDFRAIELRASSGDAVEDTVSIPWPRAGQIFRAGQCPAFDLLSGGRRRPAELTLLVRDRDTGAIAGRQTLNLPASVDPERHQFHVVCDRDGFFRVSVAEWKDGRERPIDSLGIKGFDYEVVDTTRPPGPVAPDTSEPVLSIDCTSRPPDYESGDSNIRQSPAGRYRESGARGWVPYQRLPEADRIHASGPSWFAYALPELTPGIRYRIEVDYPDDADRTFGIFLREAIQRAYPVAIGVDTGGPFPTSDTMQATGMTVWPRSEGPRLVFAPAHDGARAACARIQIARVTPNEPWNAVAHAQGDRDFVSWYEEGINFIDLFGAKSEEPREVARAIDRWAGTVARLGGTTLMPTVLVYGGQLYPSRYNLMDMHPDRDPLRRIVLSAERFGLKVIPELHPRADELMYGRDIAAARKLLLVSKDGHDNYYAPDDRTRNFPPHYNILTPRIQDWLIAMVGELADRYRDSPALEGISLRFMQWSNAALDNLVDLDWGYDDETVGRFEGETGVRVPAIDPTSPNRFGRRHDWLTTTGRAAWIDWRCRQITSLLRRIAGRVRQSRPDLKLYVHVFPTDENRPYTGTNTPRERLLEAGIDFEGVARLPGVVVVDSSQTYGRNMAGGVESGLLDALRSQAVIDSLRLDGEGGRYVSSHRYIEATGEVIPPAGLGFPPSTPATWASVAANPPGCSALERFSVELSRGDALMLGDGGNGYTFAAPGLREFLSDFTHLPAATFSEVGEENQGVVLRRFASDATVWFYAVNSEGIPKRVEVELSSRGEFTRLGNNAILKAPDSHLTIELPPYGLLAAKSPDHAQPERIVGIHRLPMPPTRCGVG